ncbi:MAG TPA: sensor histidine kinase [Alphaproteobacteria bacterium]|nr:sensor histidine kinase [Alphaproteobacteria bacterium]
MEPLRHLPRLAKYGLSALFALAVLAAKIYLDGTSSAYPFILFMPAILAAALLFGQGSGLVATAVGTVLALLWFDGPAEAGSLAHLLSTGFFIAIAIAAVMLIEALRDLVQRLSEAERRASRLAEERALLHSELMHRTQNNIQILSGILLVKAHQATDPGAKEAFRSAVDRIGVVGRLYSRLYDRGHVGPVAADQFLGELCADLSGLIADRAIRVTTEVAAVPLTPHAASVVGLIVNELVTNAFKYAFPDDRHAGPRGGTVRVRLAPEAEGLLLLEVADDGAGLGEGETGTGLLLIRRLADQLGATVEVAGGAGVAVRLRFHPPER